MHADWNAALLHPLVEAIRQALTAQGAQIIRQLRVPGSWELVMGARHVITTCRPHAVLCMGLLLKGRTHHFEVLSQSVADALMSLS